MKSSVAVLGLFLAVAIAHPVHDDRRRAMSSWSGWMPGSGMTMFTSGEDPWGMQPPPIWRMDDEGMARPMEPEGPHPPPTHSQEPRKRGHEEDEEEEEEESRRGEALDHKEERNLEMDQYEGTPDLATPKPSVSFFLPSSDFREERKIEVEVKGSKANASFNAWFPIVLGMYPGDEESRSRGEWRGSDERGVAAVANSVNHGRSGVASSHAIVYSGEPPSRRKASPDVSRPTD
ncbi:uncharacterized protein [Halyomorpha halys]|uniref:uncharacterized protein isoform X1 n=1 Tax=Halyomorpha halys TaxID=286706 RepID=UPI0006D4CB15|nr:uncharacterized protein LOC106685697 isoform X1 [Halyomorpha halys]